MTLLIGNRCPHPVGPQTSFTHCRHLVLPPADTQPATQRRVLQGPAEAGRGGPPISGAREGGTGAKDMPSRCRAHDTRGQSLPSRFLASAMARLLELVVLLVEERGDVFLLFRKPART